MIIQKILTALRRFRDIPKTKHKPYPVIVFELIYWVILNRGEINVFFDYELYKSGKKIKDYALTRDFNRIERLYNSPDYFSILEDKYFFNQIVTNHGLRIPKTLYLIDRSSIFNIETDKYISIEEFLNHNLDGFCKLINGFGGKMIYRVEISNNKLRVNGEDKAVSDFFADLGKRKFIIQERIIQHNDMNTLNPSCINTLRVVTIKTGKEVHLYQVYLRIGINNSFVDNSLSGNIMIGIDEKTGKLLEYAYTTDYNNFKINIHPQTKTIFKDFQVPFFQESIEMTKSLHTLFQQFFFIGWDIGITPEGPIVIEGNNISGLYSFQVLYGGIKSSFFNYTKKYQSLL